MSYVIGVDVGSQSLKAVLVDEQGSMIAKASSSYGISYPSSGWAEQDPADWERALAESVRELRAKAGVGRADVRMLALACQVDGLVALGAVWLASARPHKLARAGAVLAAGDLDDRVAPAGLLTS